MPKKYKFIVAELGIVEERLNKLKGSWTTEAMHITRNVNNKLMSVLLMSRPKTRVNKEKK